MVRVPAAVALLIGAAVTGELRLATPSGSDLPALAHENGVQVLRPSQVPRVLGQALAAVEDERYYVHHRRTPSARPGHSGPI